MNQLILALLALAAVSYVVGGLSRFLKFQLWDHDPRSGEARWACGVSALPSMI
jgi:hypothetical protein